jgi:pimeloyl-ACP methyl ester carboxylesterase/DNA-binding CsgD family transcriptional regulator
MSQSAPGPAAPPLPKQIVRYVRADDGVQLAWAQVGAGPVLVKAAHWITHLQAEWEVWPHWLGFFARHFRLLRYDERGCGMSDRDVGEVPLARSLADLEAVVAAAAPAEPFVLLGISHGAAAAVAFAAAHPERVSRLVLYGAFVRGIRHSASPEALRRFDAMLELVGAGWASDNSTFRQLFTSRFLPAGTPAQLARFNDLCLRATSGATAAQIITERSMLDCVDLLPRVGVPTLVVHARGDQVAPLAQARRIASEIAGAELVELDSRNHLLLPDEPAWEHFCAAVLDFTGRGTAHAADAEDAVFATLSPRERDVLGLLTQGLANAQIARRLAISDKTVRNHLSRVFDKLGVWTRAEAIVCARERGFGG